MTYKKSTGKWSSLFKARPSLKSSSNNLSGTNKWSQYKVQIHLLILWLGRMQKTKNAGYIKMIFGNGPENQDLRKPGSTSRLTLQERSSKPNDYPGPRRQRGMQQMWNTHKAMRRFSPRCSSTTHWQWKILQRRHNLTKPWPRCWQRQSRSSQPKSLP